MLDAAKQKLGEEIERLNHELNVTLPEAFQTALAKIPTDGAGLGSKVVVQDQATKQSEAYELVIPDSMNFDDPTHISIASPLGRAMVEKKVGDVVTVQLPAGVRKLKILELVTFHQQAAADH